MKMHTRCPICESDRVEMFFSSKNVPVHCNVLYSSAEEATRVPRGDLKLGFCRACGHLYNYAFDERLMTYAESYENSLHFSPRFQQYAENLANELISRYNIRNKNVIEIGCGKGEFLKLLCDKGDNRGVGFDKSFVPAHIGDLKNERFTVIQDHYDERFADDKADFLCCRHVLEHLASPREFLLTVRRAIGDRENCPVYFEVPNGLFTLRDFGVWDLIYEHCSYFTPHSLQRVFAVSGFQVKRIGEQYEGQFLGVEAVPADVYETSVEPASRDFEELAHHVFAFAAAYRNKIELWGKRLLQFREADRRVVVWGGGSKGATFLNVLGGVARVEFVVDLNPRKHKKFTAGTAQQIVSPEFLTEYKPHVVIVMNPIYLNEIREMTQRSDSRPELLVA